MEKVFCKDGEQLCTWSELFDHVKQARYYYPAFKYDSLIDFYTNLLVALTRSKPIYLLDRDVSQGETAALGIADVHEKEPVEPLRVHNLEQLLAMVKASQSTLSVFTSGTTGQPKQVSHPLSSFLRSVRLSPENRQAVWGFAYNPTHMAGMQVFFQSLLNQATLVNVFEKKRTEVLGLIERCGITHISATPTFYRLLLPFEKEYPSVVRVTFGGEKSTPQLHETVKRIFPNARINNIYASTEAGALFSAKGSHFQIPEAIREKALIQDGELLLHKSLLGNSDSFSFENDFYRTGDLVQWVDESQGTFSFVSRKNEAINVGGYKVNPAEVEETIMNHIPQVRNCMVYAKANSILGNMVCCDMEMKPGSTISEPEIKALLAAHLQPFKIPRIIKFVEQLEVTRTGKIKRK